MRKERIKRKMRNERGKKKKRKKRKKKNEEGSVLAAGRFHLPAVIVCWMKESYEGANIERWVAWSVGRTSRNEGCLMVEG